MMVWINRKPRNVACDMARKRGHRTRSRRRWMDIDQGSRVLYIEPLYGGSHKQLMDLLLEELPGDLYTLPATKWHWRMRTSALHFSITIPRPQKESYRTLFASSVLNLCELVALRPDLCKLHKVLYFHENQLIYPVRKQQDRDFQYGYNEILSCLVADKVLFNSSFNMNSFLDSIDSYLKLIPDHRPKGLTEKIRTKCSVLYFPLRDERTCSVQRQDSSPVNISSTTDGGCTYKTSMLEPALSFQSMDDKASTSLFSSCTTSNDIVPSCAQVENSLESVPKPVANGPPLHIVWPHRWEHDKGPQEFSAVIARLVEIGLEFKLSILGSHTNDIPECFLQLFPLLGARLQHKGPVPRSEYWQVLTEADVVVSTSKHEFFGVAMMEAVACGCYPLCPNRLVYPEFYPDECLYNTETQLFKRLKRFCQHPHLSREARILDKMSLSKFEWENLKTEYHLHLNIQYSVNSGKANSEND